MSTSNVLALGRIFPMSLISEPHGWVCGVAAAPSNYCQDNVATPKCSFMWPHVPQIFMEFIFHPLALANMSLIGALIVLATSCSQGSKTRCIQHSDVSRNLRDEERLIPINA